jgi:ML domain
MDFVAPVGANTLSNVVNAFVLGIDSGYELVCLFMLFIETLFDFGFFPSKQPPEAVDACNAVGCPVAAGSSVTYGLDVTVVAPITGVTATIQYQMLNENNEIMVCFRANANIQ